MATKGSITAKKAFENIIGLAQKPPIKSKSGKCIIAVDRGFYFVFTPDGVKLPRQTKTTIIQSYEHGRGFCAVKVEFLFFEDDKINCLQVKNNGLCFQEKDIPFVRDIRKIDFSERMEDYKISALIECEVYDV